MRTATKITPTERNLIRQAKKLVEKIEIQTGIVNHFLNMVAEDAIKAHDVEKLDQLHAVLPKSKMKTQIAEILSEV